MSTTPDTQASSPAVAQLGDVFNGHVLTANGWVRIASEQQPPQPQSRLGDVIDGQMLTKHGYVEMRSPEERRAFWIKFAAVAGALALVIGFVVNAMQQKSQAAAYACDDWNDDLSYLAWEWTSERRLSQESFRDSDFVASLPDGCDIEDEFWDGLIEDARPE